MAHKYVIFSDETGRVMDTGYTVDMTHTDLFNERVKAFLGIEKDLAFTQVGRSNNFLVIEKDTANIVYVMRQELGVPIQTAALLEKEECFLHPEWSLLPILRDEQDKRSYHLFTMKRIKEWANWRSVAILHRKAGTVINDVVPRIYGIVGTQLLLIDDIPFHFTEYVPDRINSCEVVDDKIFELALQSLKKFHDGWDKAVIDNWESSNMANMFIMSESCIGDLGKLGYSGEIRGNCEEAESFFRKPEFLYFYMCPGKTIVHGDLKLDNIVGYTNLDGKHVIKLVGTSMMKVDNPLWDIASLFCERLDIYRDLVKKYGFAEYVAKHYYGRDYVGSDHSLTINRIHTIMLFNRVVALGRALKTHRTRDVRSSINYIMDQIDIIVELNRRDFIRERIIKCRHCC